MSLDPLACGHDNVKQSKIVALTVSLGDKKAQYSRWQPDNLTVDAEMQRNLLRVINMAKALYNLCKRNGTVMEYSITGSEVAELISCKKHA